jgi:AbrB family looped-hinge helix DNA binding protein
MNATTIREKGQITLPKNIRNALGLEEGDRVDWEAAGAEIHGRKVGADRVEVLERQDVDPETLLPKEGQIAVESMLQSLHNGRDRQ